MEPLFVDYDFGRGFDSRRLHHSLFNDLAEISPCVVQYRTTRHGAPAGSEYRREMVLFCTISQMIWTRRNGGYSPLATPLRRLRAHDEMENPSSLNLLPCDNRNIERSSIEIC